MCPVSKILPRLLPLLALFLGLSGFAESERYEVAGRDATAIREIGGKLVAGDTLVLDGKEYIVDQKLGTGSFGYVFKVHVDGRTEALKLLKDKELVGKTEDLNSLPGQARALRALKGTVSVPEVYDVPAHGNYLRMEYIDGHPLRTRIASMPTEAERLGELRRLDGLWAELEKSSLRPQWLNIAANVVYSESRGKYFLVDPDWYAEETGLSKTEGIGGIGFPLEIALIRFERHVREEHFPDSAKALAGIPLNLGSARTSPEWVTELLAHTELEYFDDGITRLVDWKHLSPDRQERLRKRLTEIARARLAAADADLNLGPMSGNQHGAVLEIIIGNRLFRDIEVADAYLQKVPRRMLMTDRDRFPRELRAVSEKPWFKDFTLQSTTYPYWLRTGIELGSGLSYREAEALNNDFVKTGIDRSPQRIVEALKRDNNALFHSLSDGQLAAVLHLLNRQLNDLPDNDRLTLIEQVRDIQDAATKSNRDWAFDIYRDQELFLHRKLRDAEAPTEQRVLALRISGKHVSESDIARVRSEGNLPPLLRIALIERAGDLDAIQSVGFGVINEGLRDRDLDVQRAARAAREKITARKPELRSAFKDDSWRLWLAGLCRRVDRAAAE